MTKRLESTASVRKNNARLHNRNVEVTMAKKYHDTKGLEHQWRYQLYDLKREQESLKKEFERLRTLAIKSPRFQRKHGVIHHAEPNFSHHDNDDENHLTIHDKRLCPITAAKNAEPGKNFFGYHSLPGSHKKPAEKSIEELEKELDDYFHKPEKYKRKEKVTVSLKEQRKENDEVQEKVEKWKSTASSRRRFSINEAPNIRHLAFLRDELTHDESAHKGTKQNSPTERKKFEARSKTAALPGKRVSKYKSASKPDIQSNDSSLGDKERSSSIEGDYNQITGNATSEENTEKNETDVESLDFYAPDGKLRTVFRMPELDEAFKEAQNARYVRTKYKREFERHMSVSEIFKKASD